MLSSFSSTLMPHLKSLFHGPIYRPIKKRKVFALCLHRKIVVTEVVLLQTMKLPTTAA